MSKKSSYTVKKHLKKLRELIDEKNTDFILKCIAYEMETAIVWAIEDTKNWGGLVEQARGAADNLKQELHKNYERCLYERT